MTGNLIVPRLVVTYFHVFHSSAATAAGTVHSRLSSARGGPVHSPGEFVTCKVNLAIFK